MYLRFQILSPTNDGAPDYNICGQGSTNVSLTNLSLDVIIDGQTIVTTTNLGSYTMPTAPINTSANGVNIDHLSVEDTYFVKIGINLTNIYDSTTVQIKVSQTGYLSYDNTFVVYGYDLGNNANETNALGNAIDYNPSMDIQLINETNNVVSGYQTKAYTSFVGYRKPFTNKLYTYSLHSSDNTTITYLNGDTSALLFTGRNGIITSANDVNIKQKSDVYDSIGATVSTCTSSNTLLSKKIWFPVFDANIDCVDCCGEQTCTSNVNNNTAETGITFENVNFQWIDDTQEYPFQSLVLTYVLYDVHGSQIGTTDYTIDTSTYSIAYDPSSYAYSNFVMSQVGYAMLEVILEAPGAMKCKQPYKIDVCNYMDVHYVSCNEYKVCNYNSTDIDVTLKKINDDGVFETVSVTKITACTCKSFPLGNDGIYSFTTTVNSIDSTKIVHAYCNLEACFVSYLKDLACGVSKKSCSCSETTCACIKAKMYDLNVLALNSYAYFVLLNKEFNFNYIYNTIGTDKIAELFKLKQLTDNLNLLCNNC